MQSRWLLTFVLLVCSVPLVFGQEKLRRSESFFGFHFDFHATAADTNLGWNFDTQLLDDFLSRTRPDYIQIDSKGHFGFSSYPTEVGYSAGSFVRDPIALWKAAADKHHLALYVHHSGIWDSEAVRRHPEWAQIHADGTRDDRYTGYLSDYSSQLLIPQIKELISKYHIDGVWVDGDCWVTRPDYSPAMKAAFLKETGLTVVPTGPADNHYALWKDFNRKAFKTYLANYVDELHRFKPDFQVASNWAYSSKMPEPVGVNVDFLSGDVAGRNCVYSAAYEARCLAFQGKPWDLMSWGMIPVNFWGGTHTPKPIIQLKQEAAQVMAVGGGYQVYFRQNRDGAFQTLDVEGLEGLAKFCRERQPFCQNSSSDAEIAVWYSYEGWLEAMGSGENLYVEGSGGKAIQSIVSLLLDGRNAVDVLMDHHISERLNRYKLIVIPEWTAYDRDIRKQLLAFVKDGGKLLVIGAKASLQFQELLGVNISGEPEVGELMLGGKDLGGLAGAKTAWIPVVAGEGTTSIGSYFTQTDYRYANEYAPATVNAYGQGKVGAIYLDLSTLQQRFRSPVFVNLLNAVIGELVPDPRLIVEGSSKVHTALSVKEGKTSVHLINAGGNHADNNVNGYSELRPTPELNVRIKFANKPARVMLQPAGQTLPFDFQNGYVHVDVPPVAIYDIIEIMP